jgi:hypothetical protein
MNSPLLSEPQITADYTDYTDNTRRMSGIIGEILLVGHYYLLFINLLNCNCFAPKLISNPISML